MLVPRFETRSPEVDEGKITRPVDLLRVAMAKAQAVRRGPEEILIAADTGVFHRGLHLGKPRGLDEARHMLSRLSGGWHHVYTGLVVLRDRVVRRQLVCTKVRFRDLSREDIDWYLSREEVCDKAGAYAIQGAAAAFVAEIRGDFTNVVGLPLPVLYRILRELGWCPWL